VLTADQLADAEAALRAEEEKLERRLGRFVETPERGANLSFGKRIGDGTVEAIDRLNTIGVGTALESKLARVKRALARIDEGTYGVCEVCGADIDPRRLRAAPQSTTCVEHQPPR
jgi:DnaK suppressor protein